MAAIFFFLWCVFYPPPRRCTMYRPAESDLNTKEKKSERGGKRRSRKTGIDGVLTPNSKQTHLCQPNKRAPPMINPNKRTREEEEEEEEEERKEKKYKQPRIGQTRPVDEERPEAPTKEAGRPEQASWLSSPPTSRSASSRACCTWAGDCRPPRSMCTGHGRSYPPCSRARKPSAWGSQRPG